MPYKLLLISDSISQLEDFYDDISLYLTQSSRMT